MHHLLAAQNFEDVVVGVAFVDDIPFVEFAFERCGLISDVRVNQPAQRGRVIGTRPQKFWCIFP